MKMSEVDRKKVTPMMKQYLEIKDAHPELIIMFRLGDFYEVFFEDAIKVSRDLELTLTGRNAGLSEKVPMCGVPHHAASVYIEKLVSKGYRVGICEQLEDPKEAKGIVERGITQIISKGTVIDSQNLKENDFNYIGNILEFDHSFCIAYTDITTGVIYLSKLEHNALNLVSEIVSLNLQEVVVNSNFDKNIISTLKN